MRSEEQVNRAIDVYADTVKRICILHLKNTSDTEDIFQEVFLKYALTSVSFESEEHEKAWLIRVTINQCKDWMKRIFHRQTIRIDDVIALPAEQKEDYSDVLYAVLSLPQKYKDVVYLYYYEGYSAVEIGKMLGKNTNTIYTLLSRAKDKLREKLGGYEIGS
ncbi:MAG: RNA polymerase sigma factor [Clostridiales bacterium]|nr:RNA polymerase sigma factor [Clostridiales bacterium]